MDEDEPNDPTHVERVGPATKPDALPDLEAEPATAVRQDVVPLNEVSPPASLKATLELEEPVSESLDDGWGGNPEETSSHTSSRALLSDQPQLTNAGQNAQPTDHGEDAEAPRLICIQGPDEGREFVLKGRDISIGRATDNDVVLNDASVSRLHCRILLDEGQYVATDQRSGNGTIVNGRRIERQDLKSGNTLKVGQTTLRFVEMGDVIKSTETAEQKADALERSRSLDVPTKRRRQINATKSALIIVTAAVVLAIIIVVIGVSGKPEPSAGLNATPREIAVSALAEADMALQAKKLDLARERYSKAKSAQPDDVHLPALLARIEREEKTLAALESAKHPPLLEAYRALAAAPKDTLFANDVLAARVALDKQLERKLRDLSEAEAEAFLEVVPASSPLRAELKRKKKPLTPATAPPAPASQSRRSDGTLARRALDAFIAGQADHALELLSDADLDDTALALKNKILKFQEVMQAGNDEKTLKKAIAFESKIASGKSTYAAQLKRQLGSAIYDTGVHLLQEQRQLDAYRAFKEALANNPDLPQAKKKIGDIQAQARDVFNQGYILKDTDMGGAREKWQRVLAMVPPEDDTYQKAKKWLESTK